MIVTYIRSAVLALAVISAVAPYALHAEERKSRKAGNTASYSCEGTSIRIYSSDVTDTVRLFIIADTHLWLSDSREDDFRQYSDRMAGVNHVTTHFLTGRATDPEEAFKSTVALARERGADAIALLGDIVSYPSERAVEWAEEVLDASGIPYYYTCGNHDWHYEGMMEPELKLRDEWRAKRLLPLFGDNNPSVYGIDLKGVRLVFVDSSTYDILPDQLDFIRREVKSDKPFMLMMHIPLYAAGRSVGYGIGHPEWGAAQDGNYKIERRFRWPEEGHKAVDYLFYDAVTTAPNLLASFAGHVHAYGTDIINGRPHFTVGANFTGAYYEVLIIPSANIGK